MSQLVADVDQLVPPESDQETVDTMLDGFRGYKDAAKKAGDAIDAGTDAADAAATFADDTKDPSAEAADAANELGATDCASVGVST